MTNKIGRKAYNRELAELEIELVKLQAWIQHAGLRVVVLFEGRDSAGKGGTIKRITRRLNPRVVSTVALAAPTERERTQYYFQRYVAHLPAAGEMVLFDRSWYNRMGVERVMGFCTDDEYQRFVTVCPDFEREMVEDGIIFIKYWLHISDTTQEKRFRARATDERKRWKLSPMDLASWDRWVDYSRARDAMFEATDTEWAPWYVVDANIKRHARLNVIRHLLEMIPYEDLTPEPIEFGDRPHPGDYVDPGLDGRQVITDHYG